MARPSHITHWPKFAFWHIATPLHPYLREISVKLRIVDFDQFLDQKGRQRFLLGTLRPEKTTTHLIEHLTLQGYGENVVAWKDNGEVASLRLPDGFRFQYHIRIFDDGEVRGHYEYTPEAHPLKHYYEVDMEERRDYFLELLHEFIFPA
jgi:hypothetical protein